MLEERGYRTVDGDAGRVLFPKQGIYLAETVKLGLEKFLWSRRITVGGVE